MHGAHHVGRWTPESGSMPGGSIIACHAGIYVCGIDHGSRYSKDKVVTQGGLLACLLLHSPNHAYIVGGSLMTTGDSDAGFTASMRACIYGRWS
jgi:hypothetical protein